MKTIENGRLGEDKEGVPLERCYRTSKELEKNALDKQALLQVLKRRQGRGRRPTRRGRLSLQSKGEVNNLCGAKKHDNLNRTHRLRQGTSCEGLHIADKRGGQRAK